MGWCPQDAPCAAGLEKLEEPAEEAPCGDAEHGAEEEEEDDEADDEPVE